MSKEYYHFVIGKKGYGRSYYELQQENKQLKERIIKAIEMFESDGHFEDGCYCEEIEKLLKGDNNV